MIEHSKKKKKTFEHMQNACEEISYIEINVSRIYDWKNSIVALLIIFEVRIYIQMLL